MTLTGTTAAKGVAVVGVGGLSAYGISELSSLKKGDKENLIKRIPPTDFLFRRSDFETSYKTSTNLIGYAFGSFMVDHEKNDEYWSSTTRIIKVTQDEYLSTEFKTIKTSNKETRKVCEESYKKTKSELESNSLLEKNIWGYCSNNNEKPWSIKRAGKENKYPSGWGVKGNNSDFLLSIESSFSFEWNHLFKNVLAKDLEIDSKKTSIDDAFKELKSGSELKELCRKSYVSTSKSSPDNYGNNAREYCSFDKSGTLTEYPTKST